MRWIGAAAAALVFAFSQAHAAPPASAYGSLPYASDGALSPDGKHIAVLTPEKGRLVAEIMDGDTFKPLALIPAPPEIKMRSLHFATNDRLLIGSSATTNPFNKGSASDIGFVEDVYGQHEYFRTYSVSLDGKSSVVLMGNIQDSWRNGNLSEIWAAPPGDKNAVQMGAYLTDSDRGAYAQAIYTMNRVDLLTGTDTPVIRGDGRTAAFILNSKGAAVGRFDDNEDKKLMSLSVPASGGWRPIETITYKEYFDMYPTTLPDGRFAQLSDIAGGDVTAARAIDPQTGTAQVLFSAGVDMDGFIEDPDTTDVVGVSYTEDYPQQKFFDPALESVRVKLSKLFANGYAEISSWDAARDKFLVLGEMGADVPKLYLYSPADGQLKFITSLYPDLTDTDVGVRAALTYRTRDAATVHAYLTTPHDAAPKSLPLVVLVHGGPGARDSFDFDYWASFLASRGYGVLQVNYRGSSGYGHKWEDAGHRQWGRLMQDDVTDGVRAMVKAGIADPARVCIVGASYGGYAALAGATLTPELYKCAVSVSGVSDLNAFLTVKQVRAGPRTHETADWKMLVGDLTSDGDMLRAVSPINHVDSVRAPILLMHGTNDTVVPYDQSVKMEAKLRAAGKNVRFVSLNGDDHWASYAATRTQMLEELEKFLAENLK